MKVIIAGSRWITDYREVKKAIIDSGWEDEISEVVCGKADGVDTFGQMYAEAHGIPVKEFPADWARHGKAAGPIRNRQMAEYADALILVWNGKSRGSSNMRDVAMELGLLVFEFIVLDGG